MSGPLDDVQERFEVAQQRLSAWRDVVLGLVTEYDGDPADGRAAQDPRLEAAEDAFSEAEWDFRYAAMRALGLEIPDDDGAEDETVLADDFYVHLVVGVPEDGTGPLLDDVVELVDEAAQPVVERLFEAGYIVPEWGVGRGDLDIGEAPEEAT
ncbi:MAG TPA: hypothetical protein VF082_11080 [Jiangellaceae bacterium]